MPLDRERERKLIAGCQASRQLEDRAAFDLSFGLLFEGHHAAVLAIARRITRNREDADEVASDAFKDLYHAISKVDPDMGCFGLLRLFAFRRAAEKYARRASGSSLEQELDAERQPDPVSNSPSSESWLIHRAEARIQLSTAESLARIVCGREAGSPVERIVFLLSRTLAYKPARLVDVKFSERRLGAVSGAGNNLLPAIEPELECEWVRRSDLPPEQIAGLFEPLRKDMDVVLSAYPLHGRTRDLYREKPIWRLPISQGRLLEYFRTTPPTEDIRMWCVNVEKRVVKLARSMKREIAGHREAQR
jgi:DNA-directed RNA polymerase specialized sigma24 family protein